MANSIVPNSPVGGPGGTNHRVPAEDHGQIITKLEIWENTTTKESWHVIFGIIMTWDDGTSQTFGTTEGKKHTLDLIGGERITRFTIFSGYRVDGIRIFTNQNQQVDAGGKGGSQYDMEVGSGFLHGFNISSGYTIDNLGPWFYKFKQFSSSIVVNNNLIGHGGGTPFWACRADSNYMKVKGLEVWYSTVLRAIRITWQDDTKSKWYGSPNVSGDRNDYFGFDVDKAEFITDMIIRGGDRVDRIWFKTSLEHTFQAGGDGGSEVRPNRGSGYLAGFEGRSGYEIDSLAPIFLAN